MQHSDETMTMTTHLDIFGDPITITDVTNNMRDNTISRLWRLQDQIIRLAVEIYAKQNIWPDECVGMTTDDALAVIREYCKV